MKKMYKGKVNSPATLLVETIDSSVTSIKVADGAVFPEGPNVAVIGTDGNAETIKYDSINGNILVGCVRGFQGKASVWDKDTIIARNFTEYDLDALQENILELDKKELKDFQEDENHRLVTDTEKKKWNDKVSQSQITGDANATGSDKTFSVDFINTKLKEIDDVKLDQTNITDSYYGVSSSLVLSQKGVYELSEELQQMMMSNINFVNSNIPEKLSQLENDTTFKTEAEIKTLINNSTKLKKEVVTSLPSTGKDDVIYLLKNKNDTNNYYTEYMWIGGRWEIIGDTKVDLSGYAKKTEVVTSVNGKKGDMMVDFFVGDDTRSLNYTPKDYLEHGARYKNYTNSQFEFKRCTTVGVDRLITQDYCIVNTQVPWADKSGGLPMQIAYGKGVMAIRTAKDENTWGEWQKVSTTTDLPTKLSQLSEDSTHRVVTDAEKQTWNDKVDKVSGKGLSTNDYDTTAKSKVDAIPDNPKYTDTTYDLSKYAEKSNIGRCKTKGYNTSNTWQSLGTERDLEDWIGDFDKRTRELKEGSGGGVEEISLPSSAPSQIKAYKCGHLVTIVIDSCSANTMARMDLTLPSKIRPVGDGVVIFTPEGGSTSYLRIRSSGDMYLGNFSTNGNVCATITYITNN